ncbi:MAG: hypothetical protein N4A49_11560 [Marinifilaceae bacterium]|jgi:hypothetical protein|nr:hypothetical protein [Marinifilaceae bacterium]
MDDSRKNVQDIINTLKQEFTLSPTGSSYLGDFALVKDKIGLKFKKAWKVENSNSEFKLCWISYTNSFEVASHTGGQSFSESCNYFVGYLKHSLDLAHTLIRPETFEDKLRELFNREEIDFKEYKKFSRRYYVLSNNENRLRDWLNDEFVGCLQNLDGFSIEFLNDTCLFRFSKSACLREALDLCKIGLRLSEIV